MASVSEVISLLQELREDIIIGNKLHLEKEEHYYSELSDEEYQSKSFKMVLCGQIAELFLSKIKMYGYNGTRVFIESPFMANQYDLVFDERYVMAVVEDNQAVINEYENKILFVNSKKHTHGVIETSIGSKKYLADPKAGLLYTAPVNALRKGVGIADTWRFMDQYKYILSSYHMQRFCTPIYSTRAYWTSIRSVKRVGRFAGHVYVDYFQRRKK